MIVPISFVLLFEPHSPGGHVRCLYREPFASRSETRHSDRPRCLDTIGNCPNARVANNTGRSFRAGKIRSWRAAAPWFRLLSHAQKLFDAGRARPVGKVSSSADGIYKLNGAEERTRHLNSQGKEQAELLTDAQEQIRKHTAERAELLKQLAEAEGRMKELALEVAALRNSTSWRVTAPIRSMIERLRSI